MVQQIHERQTRPDKDRGGLSHCLQVEENVWQLIRAAPRAERFLPVEYFLLSVAACCHDFDKGLKSALREHSLTARALSNSSWSTATNLGSNARNARRWGALSASTHVWARISPPNSAACPMPNASRSGQHHGRSAPAVRVVQGGRRTPHRLFPRRSVGHGPFTTERLGEGEVPRSRVHLSLVRGRQPCDLARLSQELRREGRRTARVRVSPRKRVAASDTGVAGLSFPHDLETRINLNTCTVEVHRQGRRRGAAGHGPLPQG